MSGRVDRSRHLSHLEFLGTLDSFLDNAFHLNGGKICDVSDVLLERDSQV